MRKISGGWLGIWLAGGLMWGEYAFAQNIPTPVPSPVELEQRFSDVPYVPTPAKVVMEMLQLAGVKSDDVLYDLGSGDGRILITAAKEYGVRGTGIEINMRLVLKSRENAEKAGVADRVKFLHEDLFDASLSEATVVTLYLLPDVNLRLRPKLLRELKPGTRIVSHNYNMGDWKPDRVVQVQGNFGFRTLYLWVVPDKIPENLLK